jgi:hypothetical protein
MRTRLRVLPNAPNGVFGRNLQDLHESDATAPARLVRRLVACRVRSPIGGVRCLVRRASALVCDCAGGRGLRRLAGRGGLSGRSGGRRGRCRSGCRSGCTAGARTAEALRLALQRLHPARVLNLQPRPHGDEERKHDPDVTRPCRVVVGQVLEQCDDEDEDAEHDARHCERDRDGDVDRRHAGNDPRDQHDREDPHDDPADIVPRADARAAGAQRPKVEVDLLPVEEADDQEEDARDEHELRPPPESLQSVHPVPVLSSTSAAFTGTLNDRSPTFKRIAAIS